ncbi:hypothetical protein K3495_g241 [Podosphaera aphanis]|nr:hypothetical protein K3495_g241 [Podosphaera aphanis]
MSSTDDHDVRLVVEALLDLWAVVKDLLGLTQNRVSQAFHDSRSQLSKPSLSHLKTDHHPLIISAIDVLLSMYSAFKDYSSRLKSSVGSLEKQPLLVIKLTDSVGCITGEKYSVRWILSGGRPSHHIPPDSDVCARCLKGGRKPYDDGKGVFHKNIPTDQFHTSQQKHYRLRGGANRFLTPESLFAYSDVSSVASRSSNESHQSVDTSQPQQNDAPRPPTHQPQILQTFWPPTLLRHAHRGPEVSLQAVNNLISGLEQLRCARNFIEQNAQEFKGAISQHHLSFTFNEAEVEFPVDSEPFKLIRKIQAMKNHLVGTLQANFRTVSWYVAPALPSGAQELVRDLLRDMFNSVFDYTNQQEDEIFRWMYPTIAQRILVLANEGLNLTAEGLDIAFRLLTIIDAHMTRAEHWVNVVNIHDNEPTHRNEQTHDIEGTCAQDWVNVVNIHDNEPTHRNEQTHDIEGTCAQDWVSAVTSYEQYTYNDEQPHNNEQVHNNEQFHNNL